MESSEEKFLIHYGWTKNNETWTNPEYPGEVFSFWTAVSMQIHKIEKVVKDGVDYDK